MQPAPHIITLELHPEAMAFFNQLRREYYPANRVKAHLTLFYRLPADADRLVTSLEAITARSPFTMQVSGLQPYPNGLAYTVISPELLALHQLLQQEWAPWLIPRDRQPLRPHITIMNNVTAFKAQRIHEKLQADFRPFEVTANGISSWRYRRGPWEPVGEYPFRNEL
ncbi:2'-5' RNA ligase family protein [Chitinophaga arvensicola]|uniref:2'-5' RNA ligase n=1 Tax=Chitinophaga arvensicola TaxID=29529 RepID=A0A1I0S545_9BACT|nr:2'-5' RNA ligase family protein [Chitinophaga arvensicola]SEW49740.1 2'-5' RNA ligase [Chitinophaga arvensicola]